MRVALREAALAELARRRQKTEPLVDFIPRISPRFESPHHLTPLLDAIERTETEAVRALVSVPPRHSKTETLLHGIARRLSRRPWETIAYITFGDRLAKTKSRLARQYALRAGVRLRDDAHSLDEWRTPELGGAIFTSVGGAIVGQGANVLIIDDPHKDRAEAESALHRDAVWEWYQGAAYTRVEPGGSIIITHTRWHPDDLTGRALREHEHEDWEHIKLRAIDERGQALWPSRWPVEALEQKHQSIGDYEWFSQFQGEPLPRGGTVFRDVRWYNPKDLPPKGLRISIGIDLAYSGKTKSDWSACVVLAQTADGTAYVLDVAREQADVPTFAEKIRACASPYPGAAIRWHTSTTESGVAQLLGRLGLNVKHELAKADKFTRAQPVAAKWNLGGVLVPGGPGVHRPSWVDDFVREVTTFTGQGDRHDDQVDALASAFVAVTPKPFSAATVGGRHDDD